MGAHETAGSDRRRRAPWVRGVAALVTVAAVVAAVGWFVLRGAPDVGGPGPDGAATLSSASPTAGRSAELETPSSLAEAAAQRRQGSAQRATDAGGAGRSGGGGTPDLERTSGVTAADVAAARGWLQTALVWREDAADVGAWGRALERADAQWATAEVEVTVVPTTALERIAADAAGHGALGRVVEITDQTEPEWAGPGEVSLRAAVVFGTGEGWTRPGLRLLADFQVSDGRVTAVFIDDGYVVSDPGLVP